MDELGTAPNILRIGFCFQIPIYIDRAKKLSINILIMPESTLREYYLDDARKQSWAPSVFFYFSIIKNDFLHVLSSSFDWEWAF